MPGDTLAAVLKRILVALGFLIVLIGLGTADAFLMREHLWLPGHLQKGVEKQQGPNLAAILRELELETAESPVARAQSLLAKTVSTDVPVTSTTVLYRNDRVALLSWVQTPKVKEYYAALKQALVTSFSPRVQDLRDETQPGASGAIHDLLSFLDPAISEDRIILLRVQDRLYEFHITQGKEPVVVKLVEELSS